MAPPRCHLEIGWQFSGQLCSKSVKSHKHNKFNILEFSELRKKCPNGERVGFKVRIDPIDQAIEDGRLSRGDFHAHVQGNSYRFDPDGFFDRNLHSKSAYGRIRHGWYNERYDKLVEEAKRIADPAKRRELYTEAWNIVHEELPQFHLHELSAVSAAHKSVQGYQPADVAAFTYHQGGVRTAYIA